MNYGKSIFVGQGLDHLFLKIVISIRVFPVINLYFLHLQNSTSCTSARRRLAKIDFLITRVQLFSHLVKKVGRITVFTGGETETEPKNADDGSSPWLEMKQPKHGELLLELSRIGVGALYEWEEKDNESMRTPAGGLPCERVD